MIGVFVPWTDRENSPGWIIDGDGCHIWVGSTAGSGYGYVSYRGGHHYVHRLRYEMEVGPIPEGAQLDHFVCSNPACCNPRHVRPVTARENVLRSNSRAAHLRSRTHCPRGHELAAGNLVKHHYEKHGTRRCRTCHNARMYVVNRRRRGHLC